MKKLVSILLLLALILPAAASAWNELPDISTLSSDDLITLVHQIQVKLFSENLEKGIVIYPGEYIVGEDIPAGSYRIEVILPKEAYAYGSALVHDPDDMFVSVSGDITGDGYENIGKITMKDGQIFDVEVYSIRIYPYTGLFH